MRTTIGRYQVRGRLGEGGMGIVYDGWDERLNRQVAIKVIRDTARDPGLRERFEREARMAASLSHPNICHLYEIGEDAGELFIAMERLEGESLATRLARGALPLREAVRVALGILDALAAFHDRGLVHRDLKPSNVYLTNHGVKLLDFGLARTVTADLDQTRLGLTMPGVVLGTPRYMAPEQILGAPQDARTDLFAVGVILFEAISGHPPFDGETPSEVLARTLQERPPALAGSASVAAVDRIIHRALARNPEQRYPDARSMAQDLRVALAVMNGGETPPAVARQMRRLIVLPFRLLRSDPDIDFLAIGLADAITASLSGLESLVMRSTLAAARFASTALDLGAIARDADVDLVVSGTMLRAGDQLRVTTQLVEAPKGTLLWSETSQAAITDLFELQDQLARHIGDALALPLTGRPKRDVPASSKAHELYLRANQLAYEPRTWPRARELYEEVVAEDPNYAPAWAQLGRMYRITAKYRSGGDAPEPEFARAERALQRALQINPDLPIAHQYYAQLELEVGRSLEAMVRLLRRAAAQRANPHVFAGLVSACRYCGLLEASAAAHEHVRRLDTTLATGVSYTLWMMGEYLRALEEGIHTKELGIGMILESLGRTDEAIASLLRDEDRWGTSREGEFCRILRLILQGAGEAVRPTMETALEVRTLRDPEALYHAARLFARAGDPAGAERLIGQAVERGFYCATALRQDPWLDDLRGRPEFAAILATAERRRQAAAAAYTDAGGQRILGVRAG